MVNQTPEEMPKNQMPAVSSDGQGRHYPQGKIGLFEWIKLWIAVAVAGAGVWAFYQQTAQPEYIRYLMLAGGIVVALLMTFVWSDVGRRLIRYFGASWVEFRKVVWLPQNESWSMTVKVVAFVLALAAFIYGVDSLISLIFNAVLVRG